MNISTERIEILAAQQGMNMGKLAEKADISRQTLSVLKGRRTCNTVTAHKLASALHVSVEYLAEGARA